MISIILNALLLVASVTPTIDRRALIEAALSEPTPQISLEQTKLGDAMKLISEQTGVTVIMSPNVMRLVPEGSETPIRKVNIANTTLRDALTKLFEPLGMTFRVESDHVAVVAKEGLQCLGRTPTWAEHSMFVWVAQLEPQGHPEQIAELMNKIQFRVAVPDAKERLRDAIRNVGAGDGDEVLTLACAQLGWAWCYAEDRIIVSTFDQQMRDQLDQSISVKVENRPFPEALQAVGNEVHIDVVIEPGALGMLPPQAQRNFSLNVQGQSARQVLDSIFSWTGLPYMLTPDGVVFYRADDPTGPASTKKAPDVPVPTAPAAADPYVAKITIPLEDGRTLEWLIRRSELPEDLRRIRERDLANFIEEFRQKHTSSAGP